MTAPIQTTPLFSSLKSAVHAWYCRPEKIKHEDCFSAYGSVLSVDELERYHRFHFESDKHNYLVAHVMLRQLLSKYVAIEASQWQFASNRHGKPALVQQAGLPEITFNLSHTAGMCACVITLNRRCGIDVENIHRENNLQAVAKRMFAEEELVMMQTNKPIHVQRQFYHYWTLREAYVKAIGTGLSGSSKEFYFKVASGNNSAGLHYSDKSKSAKDLWQFKLYQPGDEHVLAIAFESSDAVVKVDVAELNITGLMPL